MSDQPIHDLRSAHGRTPFEDVVDQIMLEESAPDHSALMRWVEQYPEHRDELTQFFATWAVQETPAERKPVDEDLADSRMVSKALSILRGTGENEGDPEGSV